MIRRIPLDFIENIAQRPALLQALVEFLTELLNNGDTILIIRDIENGEPVETNILRNLDDLNEFINIF